MEEVVQLKRVTEFNQMRGAMMLHRLITVLDLAKANPMPASTFNFGVYAVYLKEVKCDDLKYGRENYDYQEGTLAFIAPGQIIGVPPKEKTFAPKGWALLFDPALIKGTHLGKHIQDYAFFSYELKEALHLSDKVRQPILDCFTKILYELNQSIDKHSKTLILSNIERFLNYRTRFYDRHFFTREHENKGILGKFEELLHQYFVSDKPQQLGLPSVTYIAGELKHFANYFGDLVKKETDKSPQEYIKSKVIAIGKKRIFDFCKSVSEISYPLGFRYPQHFTRLIKQKAGVFPNEYRKLN
ncbi:MAG TPA: helix-turn-helix domain-containing protein [Arachidicoccus sp.]|nr:helix-turn-helix domain-containing protein [Arachidicoccus sp.]